jgi:orotate phosphoribosyltransferase
MNNQMREQEVLEEFKAANALLEGHFLLSSGLHSEMYLQCARVMMDASRGARLCAALSEKIKKIIDQKIDMVMKWAVNWGSLPFFLKELKANLF